MKLSKAILTVLIIGTLILFLPFLCIQTSAAHTIAAASATADLDTVAITFVNFLAEGKFEDAAELFNTKMAEALPPQKLEATWNELISKVGEFKDIGETRVTEEKGYKVFYVTCDFAKAPLDVKVVFDDEGKIAGLWFVPTKSEDLAGIYIAALIATVTSVLLWGGLVYWLSKRKLKYLALTLITLPFSAIVNLWIKKPIYESLTSLLNIPPELSVTMPIWFLILALFLSPLTEEAIKLSPLVAKQLRSIIEPSSALWIGMALGIGFGIGEIWYLAWGFSMVPEFADYPFYYFSGFIGERMAVVFIHGVMTAVAITSFVKGGKGLFLGYVGAVFLHAFVNVGAMLYQIKFWDVNFATLYLFFPLAVVFCIFEHLRKEALKGLKHDEVVLFSRD